jgi:hypothetical protein
VKSNSTFRIQQLRLMRNTEVYFSTPSTKITPLA